MSMNLWLTSTLFRVSLSTNLWLTSTLFRVSLSTNLWYHPPLLGFLCQWTCDKHPHLSGLLCHHIHGIHQYLSGYLCPLMFTNSCHKSITFQCYHVHIYANDPLTNIVFCPGSHYKHLHLSGCCVHKLLTKIFKSICVHFFPLKSLINILSDICCSF